MHIGGAIARAREAVAEAEEGALVVADQFGESLDGLDRRAGDRGGPSRIARAQMRFQFARRVGVFVQVIPIGFAVAEQAMHHRAGERAVGARLHQHGQVGLLHGAVHVDVDRRDLGAAFLARVDRVRHHVDLGIDRVGAPDHHQIRLRHFARIAAGDLAGSGGKAGIGRIDANRRMKAGIFLGVTQPVDAVAHHQAHGAGIIIRPDALGAVALLARQEILGDQIERGIPGDAAEFARALRADALQRMQHAVGMMLALGIARDLGADDAERVVVVLGAAHAPDGAVVDELDFERAGRGTIVRTGGRSDANRRLDASHWLCSSRLRLREPERPAIRPLPLRANESILPDTSRPTRR